MNEDLEYLKAIGELGENEFSENVLVKLFIRMGYDRVDFNGGILEKGRDIILQKVIPLEDEPHVTIIQVKKIKNKQKIEDAANITKLTHQIYEAIEAGAINTNGKLIKPRSVILAFSAQTSDRFIAQLTPLMSISEVKNIKTIIYDGPKVIRDIKRYAPEILDTLVNRSTKIFDINDAFNSNEEITSAVNLSSTKNIEDIYMSLDFFVGSKNSYHLLSSEITFDKVNITCEPEVWMRCCRIYDLFLNKFNMKIFTKEPSKINQERDQLLKKHNSNENKENVKNLVLIEGEIDSKQKHITELQSLLKKKHSQIRKESKEYKEELTKIITMFELRKNSQDISSFQENTVNDDLVNEIISELKHLELIEKERDDLYAEIIPYPKFNIELSVVEIQNRVRWYKEKYLYLSQNISNYITDFLKVAEESLSFIHLITEEITLFHENVNIEYCDSKKEIVELRPEQILDSGYDIAVYGAAGAGKTTTLSNFAISKSKREKNSVIYIPLNRVVEIYKKLFTSSRGKITVEKSHEDFLVDDPDNAIFICILISKKILFNSKNLELVKLAITHEKTVIIDGLDEAYDAIPHILPSVNKFKKSHRCQIIISSRDCVKYLNEIDFLGITLLPFTKAQLLSFVDKWFSDCQKKSELLLKIESSDLYKEISSPLLATIACDLVEKGFNIPTSEFEIYEQRFALLTGDYDRAKGIFRQSFPKKVLMHAAATLAFEMHVRNTRLLEEKDCIEIIRKNMSRDLSGIESSSLFKEMVDPCNILLFDPLSKKYSFGHFRFQEYLVAERIGTDRNIKLTDLISQTWWTGALCLFAQKTDITFIFEEAIREGIDISKSITTLNQMIETSSPSKRAGLYDLFRLADKSMKHYRVLDDSSSAYEDMADYGLDLPDSESNEDYY